MIKKIMIIFLITISLIFISCSIPKNSDLKLNNDSTIKVGINKTCENPYIKVECEEGLICKEVTTNNTYIIKTCQYP